MGERRYDVDRLRVLVVFLLFPFHSARVFDVWEPNYVKSATTSLPLSLVIFFIGFWFMALMFFLAGSSAALALSRKGPREFVGERLKRLLLPLVFGLLVVVPPQAWLARLARGFSGSYLDFLRAYFLDFSDLTGYTGAFTPGHLWFILYLLVLSLLALPLFVAVQRRRAEAGLKGREARPSAALAFLSRPLAWLLLFIPLAATEALPAIGGKNPFFYLLLLILGFLAAGDGGIDRAIRRLRLPALILLPLSLGLYTWMAFGPQAGLFNGPRVDLATAAYALCRDLSLWLALNLLLGFARPGASRSSPFLAWASRASYPVYILHQTVMMLLAWPVVRTAWPLGLQYLVIFLGSLGATLALYELLVRRVGALRLCFGVK